MIWLHAEVAARKAQRAAIREWLGLSPAISPPAATAIKATEVAAAVPISASSTRANVPNPIMGLPILERFQKANEVLQVLDQFKHFTAEDPQNTIPNLQIACQDLHTKLLWVEEYIRSILKPDGKINPLLLAPYRLKQAGIQSPAWKKMMYEMEGLMQQPGWSTNYLGLAYDAMSVIDGLMPFKHS